MRLASTLLLCLVASCGSCLTTGDVPQLTAECEDSGGRLDWHVVGSWADFVGEQSIEAVCRPSAEQVTTVVGG